MESKRERKVAEHKGHEKKVEAGKAAHKPKAEHKAEHKVEHRGRKSGSVTAPGGLKEGRKAYDEARGHPSRERHARDAKEAPTISKEKRKDMGHMAGKGKMTHTARKVEVVHRHYHYKAGDRKET